LLIELRYRTIQDLLAVDEDPQPLGLQREADVVPLAVADVGLRLELAAASRQIDAADAAAGVGVQLPVRAGTFLLAGDQDVESLFAVEPGPAFGGQRWIGLLGLRLQQQASFGCIEGL